MWAAILVIAVQLLSNSAVANAGHHHGQRAAYEQSSATGEAAPQRGIEQRLTNFARQPKRVEAGLMAGREAEVAGMAADCVSGCCGSGPGCCATAATLGMELALPLPDRFTRSIAFKPVERRGIDPEALAKPPRGLA